MKNKLKLGLSLYIVGLMGILTLLTVTIPIEQLPGELSDSLTPEMIQVLLLLNPAIMLLIAVVSGVLLADKVGLKVPAIAALLGIEKPGVRFGEQLRFGIILGLFAGVLLIMFRLFFGMLIPDTFQELSISIQLSAIARFGFGGFTEEILFRFGLMTFVVWAIFKITRRLNETTYWTGIVVVSLLFGIGHFPVAISAVEDPGVIFLAYILLGNATGAIFFGWLYWRKGLEAAFAGHVFAHVALMGGEFIFQF